MVIFNCTHFSTNEEILWQCFLHSHYLISHRRNSLWPKRGKESCMCLLWIWPFFYENMTACGWYWVQWKDSLSLLSVHFKWGLPHQSWEPAVTDGKASHQLNCTGLHTWLIHLIALHLSGKAHSVLGVWTDAQWGPGGTVWLPCAVFS